MSPIKVLSLTIVLTVLAIGCSNSSSNSGNGPGGNGGSGGGVTQSGNGCGKVGLPSGKALSFCAKELQKIKGPKNIVYFFHGNGGGAEDVVSYLSPGSPLYKSYLSIADKAPIAVALSFGPQEIIPLEPVGDNPESLKDLLDYAIPEIEIAVFGSSMVAPKRHIIGLSLGGFNALNITALRPGYFESISALCPALIDFNPFDDVQVSRYLQSSPKIDANLVGQMIYLLRVKYGSKENWDLRNPINSAALGKYRSTPLFVSTGNDDQYGFNFGAEAFREAGVAQWSPQLFAFHPTTGGHCAFDTEKLKLFLETNVK